MKNNIIDKDNLNTINDEELINLLPEDEEYIKNIIYDKYSYLIDSIIKKYRQIIRKLKIDYDEIYAEASYGFSDGINSYIDNKDASLKTFLSLCIERRVINYIKKNGTKKKQIFNDMMSLEYSSNGDKSPIDFISDKVHLDPLKDITGKETIKELLTTSKNSLSEFEYKVFIYMINNVSYIDIAKKLGKTPKQIDNTIQRIKLKMRKEMESLK